MIEFLYPYSFLLLIIYFICSKFCKQKNNTLYFSNIKIFKKTSKNFVFSLKVLKFLIFLFMVIALASPVKKKVIYNDLKGHNIVLILDASGSMIEANKFNIVKEIVKDFIQKRKNDKIGLSIFADFAYIAMPLTQDKNSLIKLIDLLEVGVAGNQSTALYESLYLSAKLFKNTKGKKIAILLTDGLNNVDTIPLDVAINRAKKYGIKVYTIGIGNGYRKNVLLKIAKETNGKFFSAITKDELKGIYNEINNIEKVNLKSIKYIDYDYYYMYPLDIAIGLLFIYMIYYRRYS